MILVEKIENTLAPALAHKGYGIVRVRVTGDKRPTLQVMIERLDDQSISVDDCATASYTISALLDVGDILKDAYVLEVSSPGLDRPLVKASDYKRFTGRDVVLKTTHAIQNRKNFSGRLESATETDITLRLDSPLTEQPPTLVVAYEGIQSARLKVAL